MGSSAHSVTFTKYVIVNQGKIGYDVKALASLFYSYGCYAFLYGSCPLRAINIKIMSQKPSDIAMIYKDKDEQDIPFGIYISNVHLIDQVNSKNLTYKLTDNKFDE